MTPDFVWLFLIELAALQWNTMWSIWVSDPNHMHCSQPGQLFLSSNKEDSRNGSPISKCVCPVKVISGFVLLGVIGAWTVHLCVCVWMLSMLTCVCAHSRVSHSVSWGRVHLALPSRPQSHSLLKRRQPHTGQGKLITVRQLELGSSGASIWEWKILNPFPSLVL